MKDIPAIKGKFYVSRLIEEGEHEHQDFKYAISDARKIARSISAFANNDGGRLHLRHFRVRKLLHAEVVVLL